MEVSEPPFGHGLRNQWHLDPTIHFLNHGSFGATPKCVLAAQEALRLEMETEPVRFMVDALPGRLRSVADQLGRFVGSAGSDLAFATNATEAINGILSSFEFHAGDEIVIADHAYPAILNTVRHWAAIRRLRVAVAQIPFPLEGDDAMVDAYASAITRRTKLVVVDHVFSSLGAVVPIGRIVAICRALKVAVLVDGAHGPGMQALDLATLDADWYVGNAHKWLFSAKGCAFLRVAERRQGKIHPAVISNFYGQGFPLEFDWIGTHDYTPWLSLPVALEFIASFGADRYRTALRNMAIDAATHLAEAWNVSVPLPKAVIGALVSVPLPGRLQGSPADGLLLRRRLLDQHNIEVPVFSINGQLYVRLSAQIYNELDDYLALLPAMANVLA